MPKLRENIPLRNLSHYKIGGPARFFFAPKNEKEIVWAVREARAKKLPIFVLGGATNLLIDDAGWRGFVLQPDITTLKAAGAEVTVGAGASMAELLDFAAKRSLAGLEWAGGLPGTVGGAIRGNAGCFGGEVKDVIESVESFDMKTLKFKKRTARECKFGYRSSIFKKKGVQEVILSATLRLKKGDRKTITGIAKEKMEYRRKRHPLEYPNIGSIFKNVPLAVIYKEGSEKYERAVKAGMIEFKGSEFTVKTDPFPVISAAKLISEAGLRGVSCGGATFSTKHPNFIVNVLNATAVDVKCLMTLAKTKVKAKFGVELEQEVQVI